MPISAVEFAYIQTLARRHSGIVLDAGKEYLAESRLQPLASHEGFASVADLIRRLRTESVGGLHHRVIEALATNETSFFRDIGTFEALRHRVLPDLLAARASERRLSLWCAACSSGQEAYSLAMLVREELPGFADWDVRILASDLSETILSRARAGRYSQLDINRGLPASLLVKYFRRHGIEWEIEPEIRKMVGFRRINLAEPWPALPRMDMILMRNVLIYFDVDTKKAVLGNARRLLREDGFVLLGTAETTFSIDGAFAAVEPDGLAIFRPRAGEEN
jgi:chemotaxis protein methyltransferase CheR